MKTIIQCSSCDDYTRYRCRGRGYLWKKIHLCFKIDRDFNISVLRTLDIKTTLKLSYTCGSAGRECPPPQIKKKPNQPKQTNKQTNKKPPPQNKTKQNGVESTEKEKSGLQNSFLFSDQVCSAVRRDSVYHLLPVVSFQ